MTATVIFNLSLEKKSLFIVKQKGQGSFVKFVYLLIYFINDLGVLEQNIYHLPMSI